jgi:hypothetical protein
VSTPSAIRNLAAFVLLATTPVLVVWFIGPTTVDDVHPHYAMGPYPVPVALERIAAVSSLFLAIASVAALVWSWRTEPPRPGWASVVAPLVVVGAIIGLAYRALTAAVIGANIGAAIMVIFGTPVVVGLILVSFVSAWRRRPMGVRAGATRGAGGGDGDATGARRALLSELVDDGATSAMEIERERASTAVRTVVWVGLVILVFTVAAFVWLFVLGHGFSFA